MNRLLHVVVLLLLSATVSALTSSRQLFVSRHQQGEIKEYCDLETYEPECWKNEVIVIDEAIYGRRHIGKCISPDDIYSEIADNPQYLGCFANVLHLLDAKCSGRQSCQVRIPDVELERTKPCLKDLKLFLEVRHHCVEVVEPDRSCVVSVTSSPLHIAAAAAAGVSQSTQSNVIGCGTKTQPWMLEAPAGQRINISLLDFTAAAARQTSQHLTRSTSRVFTTSSSSSSGSCVDENQQYGYIIDKSSVNNKNVSVCHARSNRQTHIYLSTSNTLQLVIAGGSNANFLLKINAVGCSNLIPPEDAWIKREDDKIIIGCYTSRQTWQLRCRDGRWTGVVSNCSSDISRGMQVAKMGSSVSSSVNALAQHQVAAVIAVGFVGLAVCLSIICCGVVCLRRFQSQYNCRKKMLEKSQLSYNYVQTDALQTGFRN